MEFESLIFDIDGTLWDTRGLVAEGWNEQLRKEGLDGLCMTVDQLTPLFGKVAKDLADVLFAALPEAERMPLMERCLDHELGYLWGQACKVGYPGVKETLEALAAKYRLSAAGKKDSLDICFLEEGDSHGEFIARFTGSAPEGGEILDTEGRILGYHQGIHHYTVGQRRGLGVAASERLYVCGLDPEHRRVILGGKEKVETETVTLEDFILHAPLPADGLTAKVRYRDRETAVQVELLGEGRARLYFAEPKTAAAPGQSAVIFYRNFVLAGGRIAGFEPLK